MEQALDALRAMGLKLAVFSNKPDEFAGKVCEELFGNRFDLVAGNRPGIPVKPDPTGLFAAVERLGVRPEECLYCGDSWVDVDTGKKDVYKRQALPCSPTRSRSSCRTALQPSRASRKLICCKACWMA